MILESSQDLPRVDRATDEELYRFIGLHGLAGLGIGPVDAQLLASATLTPDALLWTRDKRLRALAERPGRHAGPG